jgi:membrane-associated phospholipid phosphatase
MQEYLQGIDEFLFLLFNSSISNSLFDYVMPVMRDKTTWVPFYILFAALIIWKFRIPGLLAVLFVGIAAGLCDYTSSSIVKPFFDRLRPCNDPEFSEYVRLLINCGSGKSFTSSHATNHFGIAMIITLLFNRQYSWVLPVTFIWAGVVSFAQIYVGVHYPLDILGGAILGMTLSGGVWYVYNALPEKYRVNEQ